MRRPRRWSALAALLLLAPTLVIAPIGATGASHTPTLLAEWDGFQEARTDVRTDGTTVVWNERHARLGPWPGSFWSVIDGARVDDRSRWEIARGPESDTGDTITYFDPDVDGNTVVWVERERRVLPDEGAGSAYEDTWRLWAVNIGVELPGDPFPIAAVGPVIDAPPAIIEARVSGSWVVWLEGDAIRARDLRTLDPPVTLATGASAPLAVDGGLVVAEERGEDGGLPVFGYPLTEEYQERSQDIADAWFTVQVTERQRFESHPELAGTPYAVLLGRLGAELLALQGRDWQDFPKADRALPHYIPETGHAIAPEFWAYWSTHGLDLGDPGVSWRESVALSGYPLSEPLRETNADGDMVLTQYVERAVFEWHPDNPEPYQVLLRRLGAELLDGRGW